MYIDGVERVHGDGYTIFYINDISDALKDTIREDLTRVCHGGKDSQIDTGFYTYEETIKELWERYRSKSSETKTGMIGELLAHILIPRYLENFMPISMYFSLSDRRIKQGFDLNFMQDKTKLWYGEVKSSISKAKIDSKNNTLLNKAKDTLTEYFSTAETIKSKWMAASNEVAVIFADEEARSIKDLLRYDYQEERVKNASSTANVILISVPFSDINNGRLDKQAVNQYRKQLIKDNIFGDCLIISIQKSTIQAIEDFLKSEAGI
jgi:hypothetical protein